MIKVKKLDIAYTFGGAVVGALIAAVFLISIHVVTISVIVHIETRGTSAS